MLHRPAHRRPRRARHPVALRELVLFDGVDDRRLRTLRPWVTAVDVPAGQVLMRQGGLGTEVFLIGTGVATVTRDGQEIARLGPGDVAGEMALLGDGRRSATVTALTPMTGYVCTTREFASLRAAVPEVGDSLVHLARERAEANRVVSAADGPAAALWRSVELPGRGTTYACDLPGPRPDAPTVVLLHGLAATGAFNWGPLLAPLNEHYRVVALDHRGHGRGLAATDTFTLEDCADDAIALLDVLGIETAIIVGYSMGGPVAQLLWRRHPERVAGLVLCATAADFRGTRAQRMLADALAEVDRASRLIPRPLRTEGASSLLGSVVADPAQRDELRAALRDHDTAAVREAGRVVRHFSSNDWISEVSVPAAVVVTTRDRLVPTKQQLDLAARITGARVVEVDGNHLVFCTRPELFATGVLEACELVARDLSPADQPETAVDRRRWLRRIRLARLRHARRGERSRRGRAGAARQAEGVAQVAVGAPTSDWRGDR